MTSGQGSLVGFALFNGAICAAGIRSGQIWTPKGTSVSRKDRPELFWFVVVCCGIIAVLALVAALFPLGV